MLTIDDVSYDDYIVESTYDVNESPEYTGTDYFDGWWKKHRTVARTRVIGKVTLAMPPSVYNDFLENLTENEGAEGDHEIRLYVNNRNENKNIVAYISIDGKVAISTKAYGRQKVFFNAILTIEER